MNRLRTTIRAALARRDVCDRCGRPARPDTCCCSTCSPKVVDELGRRRKAAGRAS